MPGQQGVVGQPGQSGVSQAAQVEAGAADTASEHVLQDGLGMRGVVTVGMAHFAGRLLHAHLNTVLAVTTTKHAAPCHVRHNASGALSRRAFYKKNKIHGTRYAP